ncbi:MAG: type II toxin-antitoxin system RelE/ParE family toxin [Terriglobales bacterium]
MAYLVKITPRAERDLDQIYEQINAEHSFQAVKWYESLSQRILSLEHYPNRGLLVRIQGKERCLIFGRKPAVYRIIYRVLERQKRVDILHIRHGTRREPKRFDLT